jgi:lysophospholipase L1-like esterase
MQAGTVGLQVERVLRVGLVCVLLLGCAACAPLANVSGLTGEKGLEVEMSEGVREGAPVVYVALGDSTGVGVGAQKGGGYVARLFHRIERARPGSRLVNLCVSGATTADVLRGQVASVAAARPTVVTLAIGINDISHNLTVEQFARNYEQIIARIREATDAPVVLSNLPDISYAPVVPAYMREEARRRINLFNAAIDALAARHRLRLVDAYEPSHRLIPTHPEFFSSDHFHPSQEGYEFWAVVMWPAVREAIGEDA